MSKINQLHEQAMDTAEKAFLAILQKVPSKLEEIKTKIALLEGGKEIIREIEMRFARYGLI
jgi:hypothetical protein